MIIENLTQYTKTPPLSLRSALFVSPMVLHVNTHYRRWIWTSMLRTAVIIRQAKQKLISTAGLKARTADKRSPPVAAQKVLEDQAVTQAERMRAVLTFLS